MSVLDRVKKQGAWQQNSTGAALRMKQAKMCLRGEVINRVGLATVASMLADEGALRARQELQVACAAILEDEQYDALLASQKEQVIEEVLNEICGLGLLEPLLQDKSITEVMVNDEQTILYERGGIIYRYPGAFESKEQVQLIIDRILAPLGRRLDKSNPLVNARLANGDRVNAVAEGISLRGPSITIRKFSKGITTLDELVARKSLPVWYARLLAWAVRGRKNIAVAGGTGSGKTTLLNALSSEIPKHERIITIEDSAELKFDTHEDVVSLETRDASIEGTGEITIRDLVKNSLRMRPDRIVVGEVRGAEVIDMLNAMSTGHDGSLTTLHAGTAEEAVLRLILMARFGMNLPTSILEEQIATALDLIVMSHRFASGLRKITTLCEVKRSHDGHVALVSCIEYDQAHNVWRLVREPSFISEMCALGQLTNEEVETWKELFGLAL